MAHGRWGRIFLAPLLFLLFFLYLFWARPAAILSQEYLLADLFLGQNVFIIIAAVSFGVFLLAGVLGLFFFPKFLDGLTAFVAALVLIMTLTRYILPYSYGGFADNITCTPRLSLLGFSPWYYVLDTLILVGVPIFIVFLVKKKKLYKFSAFLFLFYAVEFTMALSSFRMQTQEQKSEVYFDVDLSQNHPNVLLIIYDSLSPVIGREFFTRYVPREYQESLKDFTFYDNFINPAHGHTIAGLPMMFGGVDYSEQRQIDHLERQRAPVLSSRYVPAIEFYFTDKALLNLESRLVKNTLIQYREFFAYRETLDGEGQKTAVYVGKSSNGNKKEKLNALTPIVYTPLYSCTPYFLRHFLAKDFSWRHSVQEGWLSAPSALRIFSKDTLGPVLQILHNDGAHVPHYSPASSTNIGAAESPEAVYQIYMDQMSYNAGILPHMLERLQTLGIYDSTKIIVLSDHGFTSLMNKSNALAAIESLSTKAAQFYKDSPEEIYSAPAFLMVKDTKSSQKELKTDSRFLAMTDIPALILSTLNPKNGAPDYTIQMPPHRSFIFPLIPGTWAHNQATGGFFTELSNRYLENGALKLVNFTGTYQYTYTNVLFSSFGDLPNVEQIINKLE